MATHWASPARMARQAVLGGTSRHGARGLDAHMAVGRVLGA